MQYKLTCGFMPQEENCHRNGQCEGCEYAEPVKPLEVKVITAPNWNPVCCSEGQGVGWFNGEHPDCCGNCLPHPKQVKQLQCRTLVSMCAPAQIVPSCVCAMSTDCPGFCAQPEFRGWLGGCCPELCPWKKGHLDKEVKK